MAKLIMFIHLLSKQPDRWEKETFFLCVIPNYSEYYNQDFSLFFTDPNIRKQTWPIIYLKTTNLELTYLNYKVV